MSIVQSVFIWPAKKRKCDLKVLLPTSILKTKHRKDLKTVLIGSIARALTIFRVQKLVLYNDGDESEEDIILLKKVLKYILTPPYLRRKAIPLDKDLECVGILPPLAIPLFRVKKNQKKGFRYGLIVGKHESGYYIVETGTNNICYLNDIEKCLVRDNVVLIYLEIKNSLAHCECVNVDSFEFYLGFDVSLYESLYDAISSECREHILIEFSKLGESVVELRKLLENIRKDRDDLKGFCLIFGSPFLDPSEIALKQLGKDLRILSKELKYVYLKINSIPLQGVESVRTEEALIASLAVFNQLLFEYNVCT